MESFKGIKGLTEPKYEDGVIYLSVISGEEWKDNEAMHSYSNEIYKRIDAINDAKCFIVGYDYYYANGILTDSTDVSMQRTLLLVNVFIILISVYVIQSAYRSHMLKFSSEMGIMLSYGATKRQIRWIFILEFLIVFPLSAISAFLISLGVAKLLFTGFLEVYSNDGLAWLIFHIDAVNTLIHYLIFFAALAISVFCILRRIERDSLWTIMSMDGKAIHSAVKPLRTSRNPANTMRKLWMQRTSGSLRNCLLVSIPIMCVFFFLLGYLTMNVNSLSTTSDHDIAILTRFQELNGFSDEDKNYIEALEGIAHVEWHKHVSSENYFIHVSDGDEHNPPVDMQVLLLKYSDSNSALDKPLSKNDAVVCSTQNGLIYNVGDTINISEYTYDGIVSNSIVLNVVKTVDANEDPEAKNIYLSDEMYDSIAERFCMEECEIKLKDPNMNDSVMSALLSRFSDEKYFIESSVSEFDYLKTASKGIYILLGYIFCVLFLFTLIIISTKLSDYIENSKGYIQKLYIIGASKRDISHSYFGQTLVFAIFAAVIPIVISTLLLTIVINNVGVALPCDLVYMLLLVLLSAMVVCAYILPVKGAVKNVLKKL